MGSENTHHAIWLEDDAGRRLTRRGVCTAIGGVFVGSTSGTGTAQEDQSENTIRIVSTANERVYYEVVVDGRIAAGEDADLSGASHPDTVSDHRAEGSTAEEGADSYRFSGEIVTLVVDGPAVVSVNGTQIDPTDYDGADDSSTRGLDRTLRIVSTGDERAVYEITVSGEIAPGEEANLTDATHPDSIGGRTAAGAVTEGGADSYRFAGEITAVSLDGPAEIFVDGEQIDPDEVTDGTQTERTDLVTRINPPARATVPPETLIRFTIGVDSENFFPRWHVDGETFDPIGPVHDGYVLGDGKDFFEHTFAEEGTYSVQTEVFESMQYDRPLGTLAWEVEVSRGEYARPTADLVAPEADQETLEPGRTYDFTVRARDSDRNLSHVAWWLSHCDSLLAISSLSGAEDTATITHEADESCFVVPLIADETGLATDL